MDPDDVISCMGDTKLLTHEDAFSLVLALKGSSSGLNLPFSSVARDGLWNVQYFANLTITLTHNQNFGANIGIFGPPPQVSVGRYDVQFTVHCPTQLLLASVFVVHPDIISISSTNLSIQPGNITSEATVLNPTLTPSHQVSEVRFAKPVTFNAGSTAATLTIATNGPIVSVQGSRVIGTFPSAGRAKPRGAAGFGFVGNSNLYGFGYDGGMNLPSQQPQPFTPPQSHQEKPVPEGVNINITSNPWYFVVGFKFRVR